MRSTTGHYYLGLDHIRAIAALIVFVWHFLWRVGDHTDPPPLFPLSIFSEGHTGVALFMVLSGYLFAKLLDGKSINYLKFFWNRALRLLPLLFFVTLIYGFVLYNSGKDLGKYSNEVLWGLIKPTLPNGGWSITAEIHFYLLLPLLLYLGRGWKHSLLIVLLLCIAARYVYHLNNGNIHYLSYFTIVGRIDQFILGILGFQYRQLFRNKHALSIGILFLFCCFFWYFDKLGGFYKNPSYPSPSTIWIYMTTVEGVAYASLVAWYDQSFRFEDKGFSKVLAKVGTYSYSIYLLHLFFLRDMDFPMLIHRHLLSLDNTYLAMFMAVISFFLLMSPIAYLSYRFIEKPFLRFRVRYILNKD